MKTCTRLHPPAYDPGATELFYENMARKGWILTGRGGRLSTFRKGEPQELRYRVEYVADSLAIGTDMPQEQLALYLDCGWKLAACYDYAYIFYTDMGSQAQELYSDPREQAETVRAFKKMSNLNFFLALFLLLPLCIWHILRNNPAAFGEDMWKFLPFFIGLVLFYIWVYAFNTLRDILGWSRLYRRLAAGEAIRRDGPRWYLLWRWINAVTLAVIIVLFVYGFSLFVALT